VKVYVDGAYKDGIGRFCYVVPELGVVATFVEPGITHNEAEYLAIIMALHDGKLQRDLEFYSDSQLVINQLNRRFHIKNDNLRTLAMRVWKLAEGRKVTFTWIPRNRNEAGKVLG